MSDQLGAGDQEVLDFAGRRWNYAGAKEQAIRETFGIPPLRYYQRLNALLGDPAALAYAPSTVNRLRRGRRTTR
jgi:hypothetical protein